MRIELIRRSTCAVVLLSSQICQINHRYMTLKLLGLLLASLYHLVNFSRFVTMFTDLKLMFWRVFLLFLFYLPNHRLPIERLLHVRSFDTYLFIHRWDGLNVTHSRICWIDKWTINIPSNKWMSLWWELRRSCSLKLWIFSFIFQFWGWFLD